MNEILSLPELHIFSKFGVTVAFDAERATVSRLTDYTRDILAAAEGETVDGLIRALSGRYDPQRLQETIPALIRAGLLLAVKPATIATAKTTDTTAATKTTITTNTDASRENVGDMAGNMRRKTALNRLVLYVSENCNLQCRYCFSDSHHAPSSRKMSPETAQRAVDFLFAHLSDGVRPIIAFFGGEPLLNFPCIRETVAYADQQAAVRGIGVEYAITTNGTLLTGEICDFLVQHRFNIGLSMDGGQETHDANRVYPDGRGSFSIVSANLRKLTARNADVTINAVMNSVNTNMKQIAADLQREGGVHFRMLECFLPDGDVQVAVENFDAYTAGYDEMMMEMLENDGKHQAWLPLNFFPMFRKLEKRVKIKKSCSAGTEQIAVAANGDFMPCENFVNYEGFRMGNVSTGLDQRWGEKFSGVGIETVTECASCWARHLCGGPCPFYSHRHYGVLDKPAPSYCVSKRFFLETGLAAYTVCKSRNPEFMKDWARRRFSGTNPARQDALDTPDNL